MRIRWFFAGAIALLVAGCGAGGQSRSSSEAQPGPTAESAPFQAEVYLQDFNEECRKVPCWLPTQFEPRLVERESVSLVEKTAEDEGGPQVGWPMDRDQVLVECIAKGGEYTNTAGQIVNDWYGIVVPTDKLEPAAKSDPRLRTVEGGYRAYVGISWLRGGEGKQLPPC